MTVRRLPERETAALLSVAAEVAACDDVLAFPPHLLSRLGGLIGSADACYNELDFSGGRSLLQSSWVEGEERITSDPRQHEDFFRLADQHPLCSYRTASGDWNSAHKVSDFATLSEFRRTELWNELYRDLDPRPSHWIDVGFSSTEATSCVFIFTRDRHDFDDDDVLVLDLLQPYLQQRHASAALAAEAADALARIDENGGDTSNLVLCSVRGVIEFASRQSRHLLGSYFGSDERGCIPSDLLAAVRADCGTVSAERDHRRLTVYSAPIAGTLVLQLVEEDVRIDLLTPRQREVIHRIALGETDAQVAMALGISTATVGKHLEQIYARLGVHTRTAAAALILQTPDPDSRTQPTSGPYALQANRDSAPRPSAAPRTTRG